MSAAHTLAASMMAVLLGASAIAAEIELPIRDAARPATTAGVPHVQLDVDPVPELSQALIDSVALFPGVTLGPTRVSLPGAVGFQFDEGVALANPQSIVGGREFAHLHPDGSLHASLEPTLARAAINAGWAIEHPWADQRAGWEGFVMIYTPLNDTEYAVVLDLVRESYTYITGRELPE